jgi:formate C-acetyltransferase
MKKQIDQAPKLCIERARLFTDSYKKTEGLHPALRRARALEKVLLEMTISINPGELIVGNTTGKRVACPLLPEVEWRWYADEADTIASREFDQVESLEDSEKTQLWDILSWWDGNSLYDRWSGLIPDEYKDLELQAWMAGGANPIDGHHAAHCCPGFERVLEKGLLGVIKDVETALEKQNRLIPDDLFRSAYLTSMKISLEAVIAFAERFSALAKEMSLRERDKQRAAELEKISAVCGKVPANPAGTFFEALQSLWLVYIAVMLEGWGPGIGFGRVDQYLYPFYKQDIDSGVLTREEAIELIALFYIKVNELVMPFPAKKGGGRSAGLGTLSGITLGGLSRDASQKTEELTRLFLEAEEHVMLGEDLSFRVHPSMSDETVLIACKLAKSVRGKIKFVGDNVVVKQQLNDGKPIDMAKDYAVTGCFVHTIPGKSHDIGVDAISLPYILELALNNGASRIRKNRPGIETGNPRGFTSYHDVWQAYLTQLKALLPTCLIGSSLYMQFTAEQLPSPLQSTLYDGCIEKGLDINGGGSNPYATASLWVSGIVNVGDSLAAIKKTVFDDHSLTMEELIDALDNDFDGAPDVLHKLQAAPKFGNDDDYVDHIVNEVLCGLADEVAGYACYAGRKFTVAAGSIRNNIAFGKTVGALPDGRRAGEPLAEGGISPHNGRNISGATSTSNSVTKLNLVRTSGGNVLNMKFNPDGLGDETKMMKFMKFLRVFTENGGDIIQFNIVSNEMLRDAQKNPEEYKDLLVRVATYSSYFVQLPKETQDEIIARTAF